MKDWRERAVYEAEIRTRQAALILVAYPTEIAAIDAAVTLELRARRWLYEAAP